MTTPDPEQTPSSATPAGRHAKHDQRSHLRRWWNEGASGGLDDQTIAEVDAQTRPLLTQAWWDDWAQPDLGFAFFISAGVAGVAIGVAASDDLPTWARLGVLPLALGPLVAFWVRELRRRTSSRPPPRHAALGRLTSRHDRRRVRRSSPQGDGRTPS